MLVSSKRKYFGLYESNDLHALMDGHDRAFARLDGCAHECKCDSQKPVVLRWECNQPIYDPRFLAFSSHYEFRPRVVRRGHPNDKPRTERSFWEVERSFLNGRELRDRDDMRAQLAYWLEHIVDHRKLEKRTALDRFADERDRLARCHGIRTTPRAWSIASAASTASWPGPAITTPFPTTMSPTSCRYASRGAGNRLEPAGLHPAPQRRSPVGLDQLHIAFGNMGEHASVFRLMSLGSPRVWSAQARQILLLRERYATGEIDLALGHAAAFGARDHATVERILAARAATHARRIRRRGHRTTARSNARSRPDGAA